MCPDIPSEKPLREKSRKTAAVWIRMCARSSAKVEKDGMPDAV